jgi:hypothetical protein
MIYIRSSFFLASLKQQLIKRFLLAERWVRACKKAGTFPAFEVRDVGSLLPAPETLMTTAGQCGRRCGRYRKKMEGFKKLAYHPSLFISLYQMVRHYFLWVRK